MERTKCQETSNKLETGSSGGPRSISAHTSPCKHGKEFRFLSKFNEKTVACFQSSSDRFTLGSRGCWGAGEQEVNRVRKLLQ